MNNVVNFLLDYYKWILVVLGVVIVTIIGFLVDSKQKRKKSVGVVNDSLSEVKTVEPLPEEKKVTQVDNNVSNPISNANNISENIAENVQNGSLKIEEKVNEVDVQNLSLSEQKPHFESREVNIPSRVNNESIVSAPKPVNAVSINQGTPKPVMRPSSKMNNTQYRYQTPNYGPVPSINQNGQFVSNGTNFRQPVNHVNVQNAYQNGMINNTISNNSSNIKQPVSYQNYSNQPQGYQNSQYINSVSNGMSNQQFSTPTKNVLSNNNNGQPVVTDQNVGINFVTGVQNGNNDNDTWQL